MEAPPQTRWDPNEIETGAKSLIGFLEAEPVHQAELVEILEHYLAGSVTPQTGDALVEALALLGDEGFAGFLTGFLVFADQDDDLRSQMFGHLSMELQSYLRRLLAIYGPAATEAHAVGGEHPDGWRDLRREVYRDVVSDVWRVRLQVVKFSGETVTFEETPSSVTILAHGLIDTLLMAISEEGVEVVDPAALMPLRDRLREFDDATAGVDTEVVEEPNGAYV